MYAGINKIELVTTLDFLYSVQKKCHCREFHTWIGGDQNLKNMPQNDRGLKIQRQLLFIYYNVFYSSRG